MSTAHEPRNRPPADDPRPAPAVPLLAHAALTLALALGGGLAGSYLHQRFVSSKVAPRPAVETAGAAPRLEAERLAGKLDRLTSRVDALRDDVEAVERSVSEVSALGARVADLARSSEALGALPGKLEALDGRVSDASAALASLRDEMKDLRDRPVRVATAPRELPEERPEAAADEAAPRVRLAPDAELARGAALFDQGRYADAASYFDGLAARAPDDARVWYHAALSHGFATSDWTGGAVERVEKGIARERAGHPAKAAIDASFGGLTTATGKDWLGAYRQRVGPGAADRAADAPRS